MLTLASPVVQIVFLQIKFLAEMVGKITFAFAPHKSELFVRTLQTLSYLPNLNVWVIIYQTVPSILKLHFLSTIVCAKKSTTMINNHGERVHTSTILYHITRIIKSAKLCITSSKVTLKIVNLPSTSEKIDLFEHNLLWDLKWVKWM